MERSKMSVGRACFEVMAVLFMVFGAVAGDNWDTATATFYGDMSGSATMGGACGYGNLFDQGYGLQTTALSTRLFNNGLMCGACYQIQCYNDPQWCAPGAIITVTATNSCPPNSWSNVGWCNPPRKHFNLSMPMFVKLVKDSKAGIIPVQYRRVPCIKQGGMKFRLIGYPNWLLVLVYNVGGAGDVKAMSVKGSSTGWIQMTRTWGQLWDLAKQGLQGQTLSFQVTTSDGRMVESDNVVPANWQYGQSFEGRQF